MKQTKTLPFLAVIAFSFIIISCSKTGPAGPQGPAGTNGSNGTNGANGATGAQGPQGDTGVANVQYSQWITASWVSEGGGEYTGNFAAAPITQGVLDSGVVLVFGRDNSSGSYVYSLPKEFYNPSGAFNYTIDVLISVGNIRVFNGVPTTADSGLGIDLPNFQIRYIIVPGGVALPSSITYEKICQKFNINL